MSTTTIKLRYTVDAGEWVEFGRAYVLFDPETQTDYVFTGDVTPLTDNRRGEILGHLTTEGVINPELLRLYDVEVIWDRLPIVRWDGLQVRVGAVHDIETGRIEEEIDYDHDGGFGRSLPIDRWRQIRIGAAS